MNKVKVLFVCMGNICRSPTAQGVFEHMLMQHGLTERITVDSAGTHAYHIGHAPDRRSQVAAARRGIDISRLCARRVLERDYEIFDYVLAMDHDNLTILKQQCPSEHSAKVQLLLEYAPQLNTLEVPDPYYGAPTGFELVLDLIDAAAQGLLDDIRQRHLHHR